MGERLAGAAAVVTGAASGIGLTTAELFAREGAQVALVDRSAEALGEAMQSLARGDGARCHAFVADVAERDQMDGAIRRAAEAMGGLTTLVNNAAVRAFSTVAESTDGDWKNLLEVNLLGAVHACRSALPFLREADGASIVNVSSVYGLVGRAGMGHYDATKAALVSLTRTLAVEEAAFGIRVNAVCPGGTRTSWTMGRARQAASTSGAQVSRRIGIPIDRWAEPREIAYPILWLCSAEASYVTGQVLAVDGGLSAI